MDVRRGFAEVNGTRLYYEVTGAGHPLVFLHGFSVNRRAWDDQFQRFADGYRVVRYDLRGHGKSALPTDESYTHAEDLKALLGYLGTGPAYLVGHSVGGAAIITFAVNYPDLAAALILVAPGLHGFQPPEVSGSGEDRELRDYWKSVEDTAKEKGIEAARELWLRNPLAEMLRDKPAVLARRNAMIADYSMWHAVNVDPNRFLPLHAPGPAAEHLDKIRAPTLILIGERDLPRLHAVADYLQEHIANARKVVLPGVGHLPHMEDPDEFNETALSFLKGVKPT